MIVADHRVPRAVDGGAHALPVSRPRRRRVRPRGSEVGAAPAGGVPGALRRVPGLVRGLGDVVQEAAGVIAKPVGADGAHAEAAVALRRVVRVRRPRVRLLRGGGVRGVLRGGGGNGRPSGAGEEVLWRIS